MTTKKVKVQVRTSEHFLREGIAALLTSANYDVAAVDEATDACSIVILCADSQNRLPEDPVLSDGATDQARIVILAHSPGAAPLSRSVLMRAAAIVERDVTAARLLVALEAVMVGVIVRDPAFFRSRPDLHEPEVPAAPTYTGVTARPPVHAAFSVREREVLAALTEGLPNKTIARRHAITEATVKVHVKHILRKLNMNNRTQVAIWVKSNAELVA